jgi:hypothetical protein
VNQRWIWKSPQIHLLFFLFSLIQGVSVNYDIGHPGNFFDLILDGIREVTGPMQRHSWSDEDVEVNINC